MRNPFVPLLLPLALLLAPVAPAFGQGDPPIGVRAAGMGGAFTGVADDATASYWNPAGFAAGSFFSLMVDANEVDPRASRFVGIGTPPLGISYYRIAPTVHHAGITVIQSVGDSGLAIGATLGVVRGNGATAFDADLGFMASGALGRIGVTVHHVTAPSLGGTTLARRVRAGIGLHVAQETTVAADVDLNATDTPGGKWREAALGVETHPWTSVWLRSGVRWNTRRADTDEVGSPTVAFGGSYAFYGSLRADAQWSVGSETSQKGWGVGLSFIF